MISDQGIAARLAELRTRKQMYRTVLLGVTTGARLVQCLACCSTDCDENA
jgi:hypothetical protein